MQVVKLCSKYESWKQRCKHARLRNISAEGLSHSTRNGGVRDDVSTVKKLTMSALRDCIGDGAVLLR